MKHLGKKIPILEGINSVKAKFVAEEFILVFDAIGKIEVNGQEVKAFIEAQQYLQKVMTMIYDGQLGKKDTITVDLPLNIGNNILLFMNRLTLDYVEADNFQGFVNSIIEATQEALKRKKN